MQLIRERFFQIKEAETLEPIFKKIVRGQYREAQGLLSQKINQIVNGQDRFSALADYGKKFPILWDKHVNVGKEGNQFYTHLEYQINFLESAQEFDFSENEIRAKLEPLNNFLQPPRDVNHDIAELQRFHHPNHMFFINQVIDISAFLLDKLKKSLERQVQNDPLDYLGYQNYIRQIQKYEISYVPESHFRELLACNSMTEFSQTISRLNFDL